MNEPTRRVRVLAGSVSAAAIAGVAALLVITGSVTTRRGWAEETRPAFSGVYPLWENTGYVLDHRTVFVGSSSADLGLFGRVDLGLEPIPLLYRVPNLHLKYVLYRVGRFSLSSQSALGVILPGASSAFLSPLYVSRLDTRDLTIPTLMNNYALSWTPSEWLTVHQTLSGFSSFGPGPLHAGLVAGYSAVAEMSALRAYSFLLHAGEVGLWSHDFYYYGASIRASYTGWEWRLGYFYRQLRDGLQAAPTLSVGVYL